MILYIYALKDTKVGEFVAPFYLQNDDVARRTVHSVLNDSRSDFSNYPEDIELYRLGVFNAKSGLITSDVVFIDNGITLKE